MLQDQPRPMNERNRTQTYTTYKKWPSPYAESQLKRFDQNKGKNKLNTLTATRNSLAQSKNTSFDLTVTAQESPDVGRSFVSYIDAVDHSVSQLSQPLANFHTRSMGSDLNRPLQITPNKLILNRKLTID